MDEDNAKHSAAIVNAIIDGFNRTVDAITTNSLPRECLYITEITGTRDDVREMKEALLGSFKEKGVVTEVKANSEYIKKRMAIDVSMLLLVVGAFIKIVFFS